MIAYSEGTDHPRQRTHNRGYDVIVGGALLSDYSDHPRRRIYLPRYKIYSSAAGRYQFIQSTWDGLRRKLKLKDFSPASQDAGCDELLRECGALALIDAGKFGEAVHAARKIWASLPGAGYGQREQVLATLQKIYQGAGGQLA